MASALTDAFVAVALTRIEFVEKRDWRFWISFRGSATNARSANVVVPQAPPPPQVEVVPVAPGPNYYWVPGYWYWGGPSGI